MPGIVKDLLMGAVKRHGVPQWLTGAEVSGVPRVSAARHDHTQPMALAIAIRGGPEFDMHLPGPVGQHAGALGTKADIAVADIRGSPIARHVAKD